MGLPGDQPAAVGQGGDGGHGLGVARDCIDLRFVADPVALGIVTLGVDAVAAAAQAAPDHQPAAIGQGGDGGGLLVTERVGIDPRLVADRVALVVIALGIDAVAAAILAVELPDDQPAAVGQGSDGGCGLVGVHGGIDRHLVADRVALAIVALGVDAAAAAAEAAPGDQPTAVGQGSDGGHGLVGVRGDIDPRLAALRVALVVIALGINAVAAAVLVVGLPGDQPAAVGQGGDGGGELMVERGGVDSRLASWQHGVAAVGELEGVDANQLVAAFVAIGAVEVGDNQVAVIPAEAVIGSVAGIHRRVLSGAAAQGVVAGSAGNEVIAAGAVQ
ncbi:hypothetical protein D9M68_526830 [compost metagenome]